MDPAGGFETLHLYVRHRDGDLAGVQLASEREQRAWSCLGSGRDSQPGQITPLSPCSPGPEDGTLVAVWARITSGVSAAKGSMDLLLMGLPPGTGCVSIIESACEGNMIAHCNATVTPIDPERWGSVCLLGLDGGDLPSGVYHEQLETAAVPRGLLACS